MEYIIRHSSGVMVTKTHKLTYEGTMMGDVAVTCDIDADNAINFQIGDYVVFNGQRFVMTVLPTATRNARDYSRGDAVQYKAVRFQIEAIAMLQDAMMLDYVTDDNDIHFTSLPNFSFYCSDDTIEVTQDGEAVARSAGAWQLADRIKANVERAYPTKYWKVTVEDGITVKPQSISVSSQSIWNTLADACKNLGINFTVTTELNDDDEPHPDDDPIDYTYVHTVTLGAIVHEVDSEFRYGKEQGISQGAGLMKIERNSDENQQVITRLYAYGNTLNIPYRYYNQLPNVEESMYLPNLMLPMFRQNGKVAYVDSSNISTLGVKEGVKYFDGSDDEVPDIYPSIVGMTTQSIYDAMTAEQRTEQNIKDPQQYPAYDQGAVDEILTAEQVTYDGIIPEQQQSAPTFYVTIKNIGFNPNEQIISGETPKMVFNSGMLAGRECNIRSMEKIETTNAPTTYKVILEVTQDTSINQYFPNTNFQIAAGDKFVLTGIRMPDIYVTSAEQRLLTAATAFLAENDHTRYAYKLTIDNIYMARHPEIANQLKPGTKINVVDVGLGIDEHVTISQMKVTVGEAQIPQYEITLSEDVEPSALQRVTAEATQQAVTVVDTVTTSNTNRIIEAINKLDSKFIHRNGADEAIGPVSFLNGIFAGNGGTNKYAHVTDEEIMICAAQSTPIHPSGTQYAPLQMSLTSGRYTKSVQYKASFAPASVATMSVGLDIVTNSMDDVTVESAMVTVTNNDDNDVLLSQNIEMRLGTADVSVSIPAGNKQYVVGFGATFIVNTRQPSEHKSVEMQISVAVTQNTTTPSTAMKLTKDGLYRLTGHNTWTQVV